MMVRLSNSNGAAESGDNNDNQANNDNRNEANNNIANADDDGVAENAEEDVQPARRTVLARNGNNNLVLNNRNNIGNNGRRTALANVLRHGRRRRHIQNRQQQIRQEQQQQQQLSRDVRELIQMSQTPEAQMMIAWLLRLSPFIAVFGLKLFLDHMWRLLAVLFGIIFFVIANVTFVHHVAGISCAPNNGNVATRCKRAAYVFKCAFGPVTWLYLVFVHFNTQKLYAPLFYSTELPDYLTTESAADLCTALWRIFVVDLSAKFIGIVLKIVVALTVCMSIRRRRRVYQFLEYTTQVCRYTFPPVVWIPYLLSTGHNTGWFYTTCNYLLVVVYLLAKLWQSRKLLVLWLRSQRACCLRSSYGGTPTHAAMAKAANQCSICFSEFTRPLQLSCEHIFCEDCISTWLERERTCPICRAEVTQDDNAWKDGNTTWLLQFF